MWDFSFDFSPVAFFRKLHEIHKSIDSVTKDVDGEEFAYVKNSTIIKLIRSKMHELGVLLIPSIYETSMLPQPINGEFQIKAKMCFQWVNVDDTKDDCQVDWVGYGSNSDVGRAMGTLTTYAKKDFIIEFFQIPQDDMDPDSKGNKVPTGKTLESETQIAEAEKNIKELLHIIHERDKEITVLETKIDQNKGCNCTQGKQPEPGGSGHGDSCTTNPEKRYDAVCAQKKVSKEPSGPAAGDPNTAESERSLADSYQTIQTGTREIMQTMLTHRELREQQGQSPDPLCTEDFSWVDNVCEEFDSPEKWDFGFNIVTSEQRHQSADEVTQRAIQDYFITLRNDFAEGWNKYESGNKE